MVPDAGHAVGDQNASQTCAGGERIAPDAGHAVRDRHAGKTTAGIERLVTDAGHAVGDRVATGLTFRILNQTGLVLIEQDSRHAAVDWIGSIHRYASQIVAAGERVGPDAGHAAGNRYVGQTDAAIER